MNPNNMPGLSKKEIEIVSWLEFHERYFFTSEDIQRFAKDRTQRYNIIKKLLAKKRIIKLNKTRYYLIPIKAKSGSWAENEFILADEMCDGKGYFVGGYAAAHYWGLTEQVPIQVDIYTGRRRGMVTIMHGRFKFHNTTPRKIARAVTRSVENHPFKVLAKEEAKAWIQSRK